MNKIYRIFGSLVHGKPGSGEVWNASITFGTNETQVVHWYVLKYLIFFHSELVAFLATYESLRRVREGENISIPILVLVAFNRPK